MGLACVARPIDRELEQHARVYKKEAHQETNSMLLKMQQSYAFCLFFLLIFARVVVPRRPLVRAPRDAPLTGNYMIVADKSLASAEFQQLLARVSRVADGAAVHSYVEKVAKVITVSLSPYALEMVSPPKKTAMLKFCRPHI